MNESFKFITTNEELDAILPVLRQAGSLAIDVEFDNKYSYELVVCLVQISTGKNHYVVDPLTVSMAPLKLVFENPEVIKIFFAGGQDIQLLQTAFGWSIHPIIDVSTIYQVVNNDDNQTSLNDVIMNVLQLKLPKEKQIQSWEDWKQRPLPFKMQLYAARDVIYLHQLLVKLQNKLTADQQQVLELYFLQLPLINNQNENSLMYAFHLCSRYNLKKTDDRYLMFKLVQFREQTGELTNTSSGFILSKSALKNLVKLKPKSIHDLKKGGVYYHGVKDYAHELLEVIRPVIDQKEEPSELFQHIEQVFKIYYPHYKYLDYQFKWPYNIPIAIYRNRRGSLKIFRAMLKDRLDEDLKYIYTSYLNHHIALHPEINLFELRQSIEQTSSKQELVDVLYGIVLRVYELKS